MSLPSPIAILGLGQIGSSLGIALRQADPQLEVIGYDVSTFHGELSLQRNAVSRLASTPAEAVQNARLVIFATPLRHYKELAEAIAPVLNHGVIITDVGSTKRQVLDAWTRLLPDHVALLPAHPIAGRERAGPEHADGSMFSGQLFFITPTPETAAEPLQELRGVWQSIGARVITLDAELHDLIYAHVSHLPQLLAYAAALAFVDLPKLLAFGELERKFLRISASDPIMWCDVFLSNADQLLPPLATLEAILRHMQQELRSNAGAGNEPLSSLLPAAQLIASSLAMTVKLTEERLQLALAPYAAGGFRDVTMPARTDPEAQLPAISREADSIAGLLDDFLTALDRVRAAIVAADRLALESLLAECQRNGRALLA